MIGLIKLLIILFTLFYIAAYAAEEDERCFYVDNRDGDNAIKEVITYKKGQPVKVKRVTIRLWGIDAPEVDDKGKNHQPYGVWSRDTLRKECTDKWLWGEYKGQGYYDRRLEIIWNHYHNINRHMVRTGAAHPTEKEFYPDAIYAIKHGLGLWQAKMVIHPKSWRDGTKQKNPHKYYLKLYSTG